jgi:hypothetical protein
MSRSSAPRKFSFISHLECWLAAEFPGQRFSNLGNCLTRATQTDYIHCGIYTGNTIEHALFGTPILTLSDCRAARLRWFKIFMHRAGTSTEVYCSLEVCRDFIP